MRHDLPVRQLSPTTVARRAASLAIVCLAVAGPILLGRQSFDGFASPSYWALALLACVIAVPLKVNSVTIIQKVLAAYLVAMGVDYLSGVYWPLAAHLQIAAGLPVAAAAVLAAWVAPRHELGGSSKEPAIAVGAAIGVISMLLLAAGLLIHCWYGFGGGKSLTASGQLAMALLGGIAAWRLADDTTARVAIGLAGIAAYSLKAIS